VRVRSPITIITGFMCAYVHVCVCVCVLFMLLLLQSHCALTMTASNVGVCACVCVHVCVVHEQYDALVLALPAFSVYRHRSQVVHFST